MTFPAKETASGARRFDHEDFGEVYRTVFKKGVITDFKQVSDDPVTVEPLVKVEVEDNSFGEWIPLFYHPKAKYWDDQAGAATEFDAEQNTFKKAWQSFRCGDEVVVLMQAKKGESELKPLAVVGFADNYPRMGENVFLVKFPLNEAYCSESGDYWGYYNAFKTAQENESIRLWGELNQEPEPPGDVAFKDICVTGNFKKKTVGEEVTQQESWYADPLGSNGALCCRLAPGPPDPNFCFGYVGTIEEIVATQARTVTSRYYASDYYYFPVGPVLFCYRQRHYRSVQTKEVFYSRWFRHWSDVYCGDTHPEEAPEYDAFPPQDQGWDSIEQVGLSGTRNLEVFTSLQVTWNYSPASGEAATVYPVDGELYAALFTPELWENPDVSKMKKQTGNSVEPPGWESEYCAPAPGKIEFLVPPHFLSELVAAGMIDADGALPDEETA